MIVLEAWRITSFLSFGGRGGGRRLVSTHNYSTAAFPSPPRSCNCSCWTTRSCTSNTKNSQQRRSVVFAAIFSRINDDHHHNRFHYSNNIHTTATVYDRRHHASSGSRAHSSSSSSSSSFPTHLEILIDPSNPQPVVTSSSDMKRVRRILTNNDKSKSTTRSSSKSQSKNTSSSSQSKSKSSSSSQSKLRPFVDRMRLRVQGGTGGKGSLSQQPISRKRKLKPDGGHGGHGGSVILVATSTNAKSSSSSSYGTTASSSLSSSSSSSSAVSLSAIPHHVTAEKGSNGTSRQRHGRNGRNTIVPVPCGVLVKQILTPLPKEEDEDEEEEEEEEGDSDGDEPDSNGDDEEVRNNLHAHRKRLRNNCNDDDREQLLLDDNFSADSEEEEEEEATRPPVEMQLVADLDTEGSYVVVAHGGRGGIGSCHYASLRENSSSSSKHPHRRRNNNNSKNKHSTKNGGVLDLMEIANRTRGQNGSIMHLELELKLIGDIGLLGKPNAGKSSTLAALSRATPAIASYPFTTLHPHVGVMEYADGVQLHMADLPGILEEASLGRGHGLAFLRHIERTKALLYVLDGSLPEVDQILTDLRVLVHELEQYDASLLSRPALIALNKIDLLLTPHDHADVHAQASSSSSSSSEFADRYDEDGNNAILQERLLMLEHTAAELGIQVHDRVFGVSAGVTGQGLQELSMAIRYVCRPPLTASNTPTTPISVPSATDTATTIVTSI